METKQKIDPVHESFLRIIGKVRTVGGFKLTCKLVSRTKVPEGRAEVTKRLQGKYYDVLESVGNFDGNNRLFQNLKLAVESLQGELEK